jgi:predicted nucleic acid-binding protein
LGGKAAARIKTGKAGNIEEERVAMRLIVDTNILFSYFWEYSVTRKILMSRDMELFSPEFALEEINKYRNEIIDKNNLTDEGFEQVRFDVAIAVKFVPLEEYSSELKRVRFCPDQNDIDFFALAIKMKLPIWSNDAKLKGQKKVKIMATEELLEMPGIRQMLS